MAHHEPPPRPVRDPATRRRDHDAIDRLTDDVLPDLVRRLGASGLGEIEVREDDWRIRLRRPLGGARSGGERGERPRSGSGGHAEPRGSAAAHAPTAAASAAAALAASGQGSSAATGAAAGHAGANGRTPSDAAPVHVIATSPAVGIFAPKSDVRAGTRVRQGDRVGSVDLLGVPQDVVAPEDGVVVDTLAEAGEGVEYGQDLVVIEPARGRHDALPPAAPLSES